MNAKDPELFVGLVMVGIAVAILGSLLLLLFHLYMKTLAKSLGISIRKLILLLVSFAFLFATFFYFVF